ncbi:FAD/NAD(P)-binding domain-containing protein [Gonapodya prolifera JEL478]|uniref:FAD/NAD(P)-binding domain-containing protein n=1 Tax=Gonapodya prolifera (strain JEL478) TaxID=1344416 RepID=A0A139A159_GONPJ|nr:FAD/NAD(P)-binding domain-containing protein [Gonapodya prolifera JEL478]|eukprot:KXS10520.1 FAD/NAD(P)-binding domain-containing protein [Gonapodya prolifera JEL478]
MAEIKNIVIVGGSYAGRSAVVAAKDKLPPGYRIIVIEPRSHFHYTFAYLRDRCSRFRSETITTIPYTYLIYAAGAKHPSPTEMERISSKVDSVAELKDWQKQIIGARRIVVVGGGGSGLEIAAEVAERYPRKKVVLVHSRQRYMEAYGEGIRDVIYDILKQRVVSSEDVKGGATLVKTTKGTEIEADLVVNCRYPAYPNVFVCGDIADTADMKLARTAFAQSALVVDNILTLIAISSSPSSDSAPTLKPRDPLTEPGMRTRGIFMPMGHTGAVALRLLGRQVAFNSWWWKVVKGKSGENMGADNMWRMLGVELEKTA